MVSGDDPALPQGDFANAFESAFERLDAKVASACAMHPDWPNGAAAGIRATLELASADPDLARMLIVEPFRYGLYGAMRYRHAAGHFAAMLMTGRDQVDLPVDLPAITEEGMIGAIAEIVGFHLRAGTSARLPELAPQLIELVLTPYIGVAGAKGLTAPSGDEPGS